MPLTTPDHEHVIFKGRIPDTIAESDDPDLFLYHLNTIYARLEEVRARFANAIQAWEFEWDADGPFCVHLLCDRGKGLPLHRALQDALLENIDNPNHGW